MSRDPNQVAAVFAEALAQSSAGARDEYLNAACAGDAEYRRDPGRFAFVLCDLHMPGLDGACTLDELRRVHPGVRFFLMSGSSGGPTPELYLRGAAGFLPKPVTLRGLARLLGGSAPGHPG